MKPAEPGVADGAANLIDIPPLTARLRPTVFERRQLRPTVTNAAARLVSGTATLLDNVHVLTTDAHAVEHQVFLDRIGLRQLSRESHASARPLRARRPRRTNPRDESSPAEP